MGVKRVVERDRTTNWRRWVWSLVLAGLVTAGAWYGWKTFFPSDRDVLQSQLDNLASALNKTAGESVPVGLYKTKLAASGLSDPLRIEVVTPMLDLSGEHNKAAMESLLMRYRTMVKSAVVTVRDVEIELKSPDRAVITFSGKLKATVAGNNDSTIVNDLKIDCRKVDGKWLFTAIRTKSVLR